MKVSDWGGARTLSASLVCGLLVAGVLAVGQVLAAGGGTDRPASTRGFVTVSARNFMPDWGHAQQTNILRSGQM